MKRAICMIGEILLFASFIIAVMSIMWFFISVFDISAHNKSPAGGSWLGDYNLLTILLNIFD